MFMLFRHDSQIQTLIHNCPSFIILIIFYIFFYKIEMSIPLWNYEYKISLCVNLDYMSCQSSASSDNSTMPALNLHLKAYFLNVSPKEKSLASV